MAGAGTAIGVDVGGTNIRVGRIAADGTILDRVSCRTDRHAEKAVGRIAELIGAMDAQDVCAIGMGIPGRVDHVRRDVLSGGFLDLSSLPVARLLEDRFGRPVVIDNDASMALTAEAAIGAGRDAGSLVMLTIGTGIGGAVMQDGRIVRGHRCAGQLGHVCVEMNGRACACGRRGCIETESSGTALGRHVVEAGLPSGTRADQLLAQAHAGDTQSRAVLERWARPLRAGIDSISAMFDPERLLLGGGLGREALAALDFAPAQASWFRTDIRAATLGDDAGVIGAGVCALGSQRPRPALTGGGKALLMVNGVPASGKSRVAQEMAARTGWPVLSIDTIKNPFLEHLGGGDRLFNRTLGKASYQAIFSVIRDAPAGSAFIVDAWFGFQPIELLEAHIGMAGIDRMAEIWCHAPGDVIAERYAARVGERPAGHPGLAYVPELIELAARARPTGLAPVFSTDTREEADYGAMSGWSLSHLARPQM